MKVDVVTARGTGIAGPSPAESGRLPVGSVSATTATRDASSSAAFRHDVSRGDLDAALRTQVPRQGNPMALLANLAWLAGTPSGQQAPLPPAVREALLALWAAMPRRADLGDPAALRDACLRSGTSLESLLASAPRGELAAALGGDWKALLLRLRTMLDRAGANATTAAGRGAAAPVPARHIALAALPPEPPTLASAAHAGAMLDDLARQASDSVARVCCNQLASIASEPQRHAPWLLEIPFRSGDDAGLLRLAFERGAREDEPDFPGWRVQFAIDLGAAGTLRGCVGLAGDDVEVTLYARNPALAAALEATRDELRSSLSQSGFKPGTLLCLHDRPFDPERTGSWLVDLRA